ncbi:DNA-methyltransferase [Desulfoluna butyratoxydans]|uniref:Methyltransferase n=1 Tax=Desulfoluna butyratoxydans TaxID=231438 RepID=A0A4U8YP39_9BACT|nr:site-specific DNA-methyltransferase [Desulfoluna butyratoxydans]VFQ42993.1 s-adenosyl-l-methionine-dependent methyltransferase [Desulfoluna butyratoxydans]
MNTTHALHFLNAAAMEATPDHSVDLVVTSPPYPMIAMWDEALSNAAPAVAEALDQGRGMEAFEAMHGILDAVWDELARVVKKGGFVAINMGDATRTIAGEFAIYPNHSRITMAMLKRGFTPLPEILWRKVSTAPNKFMGSGMLPAGAYVTQEHEYILIFRNGGKRVFKNGPDKEVRKASAIFWEERNRWYSDTWSDISGVRQETGDTALRQRSAAYPLELPLRLILMYSAMGDTVLDPFSGTGTTMQAALATGRNSISYEIDSGFAPMFDARAAQAPGLSHTIARSRYEEHVRFVDERLASGKAIKHTHEIWELPVVTAQEKGMTLPVTVSVEKNGTGFSAEHAPFVPGQKAPKPSPLTGTDEAPEAKGATQMALFT